MPPLKQLPDYGPLEIENLQEFLVESKKNFIEQFEIKNNIVSDLSFNTLTHIQTIGVGSFGIVFLMKDNNNTHYAVKTIEKKMIIKTKQVSHILNEKKILSVMNFPFIIHLIQFYSDNSYLYFVMPFISGGDLFTLLRKLGKLDEGQARFYSSQVVLAIEYLHFLDIIYRDLKPENVLLDHTGYIKLTDFGFGKALKTITWTLCGTPEYIAPEIILNKGYSKAVDWWAVGVFIFEMVAGRSPFFSKDPLKIYNKILSNRYILPPDTSLDSKHLIKNLLQVNISQRYGCLKSGVQDIKNHTWFRPIDWLTLLNRKMNPPYVPETAGETGDNFIKYKEISLKVSTTDRFNKEFEHFYIL